ncbi:Demethylsterigmatocystin 6-O-methyltransferase [Daldinia childiae]|uniref:Demethylsterigmatocystin 6-O-methyltransferase n=1 Tax=Daldinia childiae TaxID=326645 RepID=UPI0014462C33|nr:Demethylsterigmatocystin 6-O-methyltransferase [Daldinia childiae]KAF3055593.1 Demethylsterigmatocystin 6-O-methyltransferase [Daldinia childiae]
MTANPVDSGSIATLIEQLNSLSSKLELANDQSIRAEAIRLSRKLTMSLERPEDVATEMIISPLVPIAARIVVDMNILDHIVKHNRAITSEELASLSGGEALLITRLLRVLASVNLLDEVGEETWQATPITKAMASKGISAGIRMVGDMVMGAASKAPKYLKEAGYRCPTDPNDGFMQYAFQTKLTTFQLFNSIPQVQKDFNNFMGSTLGSRKIWLDWYPIQELIDGAVPDSALLVDIGGGKGHDLIAFHERYPHKGRLVLQDFVIDTIEELDPAIDPMYYDFFAEQPIKGARAYYYHHILHDWSDYKCLEILKHVRDAMKPGYSKLLLHEMIIPETGASPLYAMLDMTMMCFNAGMERTERQWRELLETAGFEVVKVWPSPEVGGDGMVEAIVKE